MEYDIEYAKRYNYFYFEISQLFLLKLTYNNTAKIYGIRLINPENDSNYFSFYRLTNLSAILIVIRGIVLERAGVDLEIPIELLIELAKNEVSNGL